MAETEPKFHIRSIRWSLDYNSSNDDDKLITPILLQELNGPCPLIALVNTLLLKYELQLHNIILSEDRVDELQQSKFSSLNDLKNLLFNAESTHGFIELNKLLSQIGEMLLIFKEDKSFDYEVDKLLESLPLLHTGLSVNPNLISGNFSRTDLSTILFDVFDLKIRHGWCLNQIDSEQIEWNKDSAEVEGHGDNYAKLIELLNQLQTFDQIQDYLLLEDPERSSTDKSGKLALEDNEPPVINEQLRNQHELARNQKLITKWLDLNKTQLTKIGLKKLNLDLFNEEFIIFFRNNHFNTLFKKNNQEFYLLITDSSFNNKASKITWQSLNSVNGSDDLFFNGDFIPILDIDQSIDDEGVNNEDYLLTKQLQEEEDSAVAKRLQEKFNKREAATKPKEKESFRPFRSKSRKNLNGEQETQNGTDESKVKSVEEKKKRDCVIV